MRDSQQHSIDLFTSSSVYSHCESPNSSHSNRETFSSKQRLLPFSDPLLNAGNEINEEEQQEEH